MLYLAWRIPFLSALNFNANTLRWPAYSGSCFWHHIASSVWVLVYYFSANQKRDLSAPLFTTVLSTCWLFCKNVVRLYIVWHWCRLLGHQQTWKRERESSGPGWVGEERRAELGGSSEAPSPDPRSGAGIKVACFMWLVWDFEVSESPTALTSSSSLVS